MTRRARAFPAAAAIILALLGWWLFGERGMEPDQAPEEAAGGPDFYFSGFTLRATDASGAWDYQLESPRVLHFADDDRWELTTPEMEAYMAEGAPWYGQSEHGVAWPDQDLVELQGPVALRRPGTPANRPMEVDTADVSLYPERDYAETAAPTEVRQGQAMMRGVGAKAWMAEDRIEFLSEVEGRYVPE